MREIKYTVETSTDDKPFEKIQHYISTLKPHYIQGGYIMRKVKNHPHANKRGYVPEHRLIMEERLRRFLIPRKELVHHIDGNKSNNNLSNLKLTSPVEHPRGHIGERNHNGQFIANEPIFQEIKIRLLNKNTNELRAYTLCELIGKTYRRGQFSFRGRYTGLKDKNGAEIYEGDIIADVSFKDDVSLWKAIVYWDENVAAWQIRDHEGIAMLRAYAPDTECEIIGNIHENPELLE